MLSICFTEDHEHEWSVSSTVFERLFSSALEHGQFEPSLEEWRHVAVANGSLSFSDDERGVARELMTGLRAAASAALARLGDVDLRTEDGTCKVSLKKLLVATDVTLAVSFTAMVPESILQRVFYIRHAGAAATGFVLEVNQRQYLGRSRQPDRSANRRRR